MTSDDRLLLILRRLDEIERNLDRMMEELRAPTAKCRCGLAFTVCLGVVTPVASWCSMVQRDAPWCKIQTETPPEPEARA
jgi:hypothetical protein